MALTVPGVESLSLSVNEEIRVRASLEKTFAALLEQLGPYSEMPDGTPMPMKLEPWPGGRWSSDTPGTPDAPARTDKTPRRSS